MKMNFEEVGEYIKELDEFMLVNDYEEYLDLVMKMINLDNNHQDM